MQILLTGGCGDLGRVLTPMLIGRGDTVKLLDLRPMETDLGAGYIKGSVLEREKLADWFRGCDAVVHIAAWHGIHEFKQEKNAYDFFDLNIKGTFEVFEAALAANVHRVVFISSTSIDAPDTVYGNSKIIAEQIASFYARHHKMRVITLRPRAFIPHWNRSVYSDYIEWAKWFWKGAVHIDDVAQSVEKSLTFLADAEAGTYHALTVDGAYEYSTEDLENWDRDGSGTTFRKYYDDFYDLALSHGLTPNQPPRKLDISETVSLINYKPEFSLRNLLEDLSKYGAEGPR